jgi:glycosyltransferase involved in cell wall biosynthesis
MANVTVIVPCQDSGDRIGTAIQSALDQTYTNLGIVVVDNGSDKNTLDVINSYVERAPNRISLVQHVGAGFGKMRDVGIERASGEWVVILDATDTLFPDAVATWVNYAAEHPEHSVIYSAWQDGDEDNLPHTWTDDPLEGNILDTLVRSFDGIMQPALIRKSAILAAGGYFDPAVEREGDAGWIHLFGYFRLLLDGTSFGYVPQVLLRTQRKHLTENYDPVAVANQRLAVYRWAVAKNPERMVAAIDRVNEIRRAQLREAFAALRIRNAEMQNLLDEIERARVYQAGLETTLQNLQLGTHEQQVHSLLAEIEKARSYQAWQDQTIGTLRQQVYDLEKALDEMKQRIQRDTSRPQQISALIDHIETLEGELAVYRATTDADAETRLRELYTKWQAAQEEIEEMRASPVFKLLGRRSSRKEQKH